MQYLGDFAEDATVYIPFNTFSSDDPQASVTITNLAAADIHVHKDGSATEIVTDGATVAIDFDSITGNHLITIDTSVDAAYSTGSDYIVRIEGTTVDAGTVNAFVGSFSIENRYQHGVAQTVDNNVLIAKIPVSDGTVTWNSTALASINAECDTAVADYDGPTNTEMNARTLVAASYFDPATDTVANVTTVGTTTTNTDMRGTDSANTVVPPTVAQLNARTLLAASYATSSALTTVDGIVDTILLDTNELQTDWTNGGRLDLLLDAIPTTAMRGTDNAATEAKQDIIDTNVDQIEAAVITNATGVDIAADIIAVKAETAAILIDTDTTIPALIAALNNISTAQVNTECDTAITDAALATAAALATVDTVADAIKVVTDKFVFTIANQVDSNIQSINDVTITGDGSATPFDV